MGALSIPPGSAEFNEPLVILNSVLCATGFIPRKLDGSIDFLPGENPSVIPLSIAWGSDGGGKTCLHVNLQFQGPAIFSKVRTLYVNNENCGVDVAIIFADTAFPVRIPAYASAYIPIASNSLDFYVNSGLGGLNQIGLVGDFTYIEAFNHLVPPVALPKTELTQAMFTAAANLSVTNGDHATVLFSTTQTIIGIELTASNILGGAASGNVTIALTDHFSALNIALTDVSTIGAAQTQPAGSVQLLNVTNFGIRVRGLDLHLVGGGTQFASGNLNINVQYK